jgi:hypothetical protein
MTPPTPSWSQELARPARPLIRLLVQARWAARIAVRNSHLIDTERPEKFLFGAERIGVTRLRDPLALRLRTANVSTTAGRLSTRWDINHFAPWSRHPDNSLDNLVAAHASRKTAKSASLAALGHTYNTGLSGSPTSSSALCRGLERIH